MRSLRMAILLQKTTSLQKSTYLTRAFITMHLWSKGRHLSPSSHQVYLHHINIPSIVSLIAGPPFQIALLRTLLRWKYSEEMIQATAIAKHWQPHHQHTHIVYDINYSRLRNKRKWIEMESSDEDYSACNTPDLVVA